MNKALSYDDVLLIPQYSDIQSRAEVSLETNLGNGLILSSPVLSSPMDTISEAPMAASLGRFGGSAIVHRYNTIQEQCRIVGEKSDTAGTKINIGAAVGVSDDFLLRSRMLINAGATFLCVDVAHGHHILMKKALLELRNEVGDDFHIMAGNVATLQGVNDLSDWGADSVRCNIGGGSICSTRIQTGHGMPGLQTIFECAKTDRDVAIIADGGLKNSGDMVKALAAGADAVMCGSIFSGTDETPGKVIEERDGTRWKIYRGMASKEAQLNWRGKYSSHEGVSARVPYRGGVHKLLEDIERGLRSGLSYSGARSISELQSKAEFIIQTSAGLGESKTHILNRAW
jgi:IMP dehydrogenase